jgi:hypothetical protein
MNNRWTLEEESKLLKSIKSGKTYKELSGGFNRSENALELRVKKIIFENISSGKSADRISSLLNMPKDKIMQYYYAYKDYINKQNDNLSGGNIQSDKAINKSKISQLSEINYNKNNNKNNNNNNIIGGNNDLNINELELELQNKKMELLINNYILKRKLKKIIKTKDREIIGETLKHMIS